MLEREIAKAKKAKAEHSGEKGKTAPQPGRSGTPAEVLAQSIEHGLEKTNAQHGAACLTVSGRAQLLSTSST